MRNNYHRDTGPFVRGLPEKTGYYWFRKNGLAYPCVVLLPGPNVRHGVRLLDGWENPVNTDNRFKLDHDFVVDAEYAPFCVPQDES